LRAQAGRNRRGEPFAFAGVRVDTFVVDSRRFDLHRTGCGQHLAGLVVAVAHHQAVAVLIELVGVLGHVGGDLGLQRGGQHLSRPVADDLIQQRATGSVAVVGVLGVVNYGEHGRTFPNQRANAGS